MDGVNEDVAQVVYELDVAYLAAEKMPLAVDMIAAETVTDAGLVVKVVRLAALMRIRMVFGLPVLMYLKTAALQLQSQE